MAAYLGRANSANSHTDMAACESTAGYYLVKPGPRIQVFWGIFILHYVGIHRSIILR